MLESDLKLISLYAIIVACLVLRISVESTGYTSPDSIYYLEVAENLLNGKGLFHSNVYPIPKIKSPENQRYLAVWPLGYPLLIASVAFIFKLPVFWASKIINFFFLGLSFLLFRRMNKERAYMLGLVLCSFTFLEIFSFSWSEGPFDFGFLFLGYTLFQFLSQENNYWLLFQLFFICLFLFFIRYIGGFSFLIIGFLSLWYFFKKDNTKAIGLAFAFLMLALIASVYLYVNYLYTGFLTGGERLYPYEESTATFIWYLLGGLFNEIFIIKNYYFRGEPAALFSILAMGQIILMAIMYRNFIQKKIFFDTKASKLVRMYVYLGLGYLLVLIFLRRLSPFDEFDYRLLSPLSISMYVAFILYLIQPQRAALLSGTLVYKGLVLLFGTSLLYNLPKVYLINTFATILKSIFLIDYSFIFLGLILSI